jgi:hypothetical protein
MMSLRNFPWLVVVAACLVAAVAAAQAPGPGGGGRPAGAAGPGRSGASAGRDESRIANANYFELANLRIAQLEEDLNLRTDQLRAWNVYRERLQRMLEDLRRGVRVSANETTAPKQLDGLADIARNRLTAVEDIVDAGKALYAVLTPEQKAIADRRLVLPLATLTGNDAGSDVRRAPQRPGGDGAAPPRPTGEAGPPPK